MVNSLPDTGFIIILYYFNDYEQWCLNILNSLKPFNGLFKGLLMFESLSAKYFYKFLNEKDKMWLTLQETFLLMIFSSSI